jgi:hypothetical protein
VVLLLSIGHRRNLLEVEALEYGGLDLTKPQLRYRFISIQKNLG